MISASQAESQQSKPPTICLNMIVRNEAKVVEETLGCVFELIDYWVIVDTGSTDGTQDLIRHYFQHQGIPGELHERPWQNFGTNRTEALHLCQGKADYTWVIDADDLIAGTLDFRGLTHDAYSLRFGPELLYWRRQIFKDPQRWSYEGVVHEHAVCRDPQAEESRLEGDYHIVSRRLGSRNQDPDKYERDSRLLLDVVRKDPTDARAVFYLAQSLLDAGDLKRALHYYLLRAEMGGWPEEVFMALYQSGLCLQQLGRPQAQVVDAFLSSWQLRPSRAEPLYQLARLYRVADEFHLGYLFAKAASEIPLPEAESLFISADVYKWRAQDERAICAFYTGKERESFELCQGLLNDSALPEAERERVLENRDFAVPSVLPATLKTPHKAIEALTERKPQQIGEHSVTLTITSCRRLDLFEKTVNSFLNCCTDLDRIDRWICIDDGSPNEDRERMRELYPFFEFIWKTPEQKGHAQSMNLLLHTLETPYWLHLEDDWHFFSEDAYVTKSLEILNDDPNLGQVLFNRDYGETLACRKIVGGAIRHTRRTGLRYRLHEHVPPETSAYQEFLGRLPPQSLSVAYWPHYSLRPSLVRMAALRKVRRFDPGSDHFELEFAQRYAELGLHSAFFDTICCLHLGPLTWERGETRAANAYQLNRMRQFGRHADSE